MYFSARAALRRITRLATNIVLHHSSIKHRYGSVPNVYLAGRSGAGRRVLTSVPAGRGWEVSLQAHTYSGNGGRIPGTGCQQLGQCNSHIVKTSLTQGRFSVIGDKKKATSFV